MLQIDGAMKKNQTANVVDGGLKSFFERPVLRTFSQGRLYSSLCVAADKLQVDRAEGRRAVLSRDGVVHRSACNVF